MERFGRSESTTVTVSYNTSMEVMEQIKSRVSSYVAANSRDWSGCGVNIDKMEYQNAINIIIGVERAF